MSDRFEFDVGLGLFSEFDADGFLGIQVQRNGGPASSCPPIELMQPFGFGSRPLDPDLDADGNPVAGCAVLYATEGDKLHAWLGPDPRLVKKQPQGKKGSSWMYSATGSLIMLDGEKGTFQVYIPYSNGSKTATIAYDLTTEGAESLQLIHGDGMALTMTAGGKNPVIVKNKAGDAYVEINDDAIVLNGNCKVNGGIVLGDPVSALPVALAPALEAWAAQVTTALTAIKVAMNVPATGAAASAVALNPGIPSVSPLPPTVAATKTSAS